MIRLLILFLIAVFLARLILKNLLASSDAQKTKRASKSDRLELEAEAKSEKLTACSVCGVYFRESSALIRGYKMYCSETCLGKARNE